MISGYLAEAQGDLSAARQAFQEIWQQDQDQPHFSPAALIGLGQVVLQTEDWPAVDGAMMALADAHWVAIKQEVEDDHLRDQTLWRDRNIP